MSKLPFTLVSALAIAFAAGIAGVSTASATDGKAADASPIGSAAAGKTFTCGGKGQKDCPMQAWMKANMGPPMQAPDWAKISTSLEYISKHPVKGLTDWEKIAKEGLEKAKKKDIDGVKAACKACHDKNQKKFRDEMRDMEWGK